MNGRAECLSSQVAELITHLRRLLKLQVLGMGQHQLFKALDFSRHVFFAHGIELGPTLAIPFEFFGFLARFLAVDAVDEVLDPFQNGSGV